MAWIIEDIKAIEVEITREDPDNPGYYYLKGKNNQPYWRKEHKIFETKQILIEQL